MDAELEEIIEAAKKHGLKRLRVGDIEVELWEKPKPERAQVQVFPETAGARSLSEEEQYVEDLFYSAGV
jgi:hypothetical protein